jgi:peptidoglycan hydrolase-like protein with peptidoglycan-binding domain
MNRLEQKANTSASGGSGPRPGLRRQQRRLTAAGLALPLLALAGCAELLAELPFLGAPPEQAERVATPPAPVAEPTRRDMVRQTQLLLSRLGYRPGAADGIEGPRTREAIRRFQADQGHLADGRITSDLVGDLEVKLEDQAGRHEKQRAETAKVEIGEALPEYHAGSTFVYSDGRAETVVGTEGEKVHWRSARGAVFTSYRNFALPWAAWQSDAGSGQRSVNVDPAALWPLEAGKEISFSAKTLVLHSGRPEHDGETTEAWRCAVEGREPVSVVAGDFQTIKVVCKRAVQDGQPRLTRVWYYAPSIGHYVRFNDIYEAMELDRHVELVAIRPSSRGWPPVARAGLGWALKHALDEDGSGRETVWTSSGVEARVTIRPSVKFERFDGRTCRTFLQVWQIAGGAERYPGTACRDSLGNWQIPGLEDSAGIANLAAGDLS